MANYLRSVKRIQLKREQKWAQQERARNGNRVSQGCPYCQSKSIEKCNAEMFCRNCHRHFRE